jgi:hypothetical protein
MSASGRHIALIAIACAVVAALAAGFSYVARNGMPTVMGPAAHLTVAPAGGSRSVGGSAASSTARESGGATGTVHEPHGRVPAAAPGPSAPPRRIQPAASGGPPASGAIQRPVRIHLTFERTWHLKTYELGPRRPQPPVTFVSPVPIGCDTCPPTAANR